MSGLSLHDHIIRDLPALLREGDLLVATELEEADGRFTGRPLGTPCFREGKPRRVLDWLSAQGLSFTQFPESFFYSDSRNDLPLLEQGTTYDSLATAENLWAAIKVYASGGENALHAHGGGNRSGGGAAPDA